MNAALEMLQRRGCSRLSPRRCARGGGPRPRGRRARGAHPRLPPRARERAGGGAGRRSGTPKRGAGADIPGRAAGNDIQTPRVDLGSGRGDGPARRWGRDGGCGSRGQEEGAARPEGGRTRAPGAGGAREGRGGGWNGSRRAARRRRQDGQEGEPGGGRRAGGRARAHLPHSRNSATYLSRRRAEWLHSVYRQTSTSSSVSTLRALSLRRGPSRSSCSSFLSRTLADMVPRGPLPTRRPLAARSASPSGRARGDPAAASPDSASSPPRPRRRAPA